MNKMHTKVWHSLPSIYEIEINKKNNNPFRSVANLKQCGTVPVSS